MIERCLYTDGIDVAVLTNRGGVVCQFTRRCNATVTEWIFTTGRYQFGISSKGHRFTELDIQQKTRIDQVETTCTHLAFHIKGLAILEARTTRSKVNATRSTKLASRLPDIGLLSVVKLNLLDVFKGVFSQVYLSVLCVSKLHAVVIYTHVIGTHRTDIDGFQSTNSTIIFDLYTREITNGISYAEGIHLLELQTTKCLRDNNILLFDSGGDGVLI